MENKDVAIIGLGPAGVSASIYLKRYGMNPICFEKELVGGKVNKTEMIENYAGVLKISGPKLGMTYEDQLSSFGIKPIYKEIKELSLNDDGTFHLKWFKEEKDFKYVILSNGLKNRPFPIAGEESFHRRGISECAICDGALYKGKDVAIIGAGNSAFEEASYLATICSSVTLIARRKEFRATSSAVNRFLSFSNTKILAPYDVVEAFGTNSIEKLKVKNKETGEIEGLSISGLFLYVGEIPENSFIKISSLDTNNGFIKTDDKMMTNISNLYAVGDCKDKTLRQVVTATSDGAIAASAIHENYLNNI